MSYQTSVAYPASAGQSEFDVTFPYLDQSHVVVTVNGLPAAHAFVSPTRVKTSSVMVGGEAVVVRRQTPIDQALVTFQNGAVLTKEELNTAVLQCLYIQQELTDHYTSTLDAAKVRLGDNLGVVSTPTDVIDQLTQMILEGQLLADLNAKLSDLDLTASTLIAEIMRGNDVKQGLTVVRDQVTQLGQSLTVVDFIASVDTDGTSVVLHEDTVKRANGDTLAQAFTGIETNIGDARAYSESLVTAIVGPSGSLTRLQNALGAYNGAGTAFVLNDSLVQVQSSGTSLASTFTGLSARMGTAEASIITNATAIATETSARATAISTLAATVGGYSSQITTLQSVQAGIQARYGVALDVNGFVSGFVQNNSGTVSDFTILANKFAIVTPGQSPVVPFSVVDGYANFANPVSVYKVGSGYKLVLGPGFGVSSDLVLWFGPSSIAISACTRANALMCLCIDGTIVVPTTGGAPPFEVTTNSSGAAATGFISSGTTIELTATPTITLSHSGDSGSGLTYEWHGPSAIEITSPTGPVTAFKTTLGIGQSVEGYCTCTITDTGTGKQRQVSIFVGFQETH